MGRSATVAHVLHEATGGDKPAARMHCLNFSDIQNWRFTASLPRVFGSGLRMLAHENGRVNALYLAGSLPNPFLRLLDHVVEDSAQAVALAVDG